MSKLLNESMFDCVGKVLPDLVDTVWLSLGLTPGPLTSGENEQLQTELREILAAVLLF